MVIGNPRQRPFRSQLTVPQVATWPDIALRLACALVSGLFIGLNRSERGRTAGLRTMGLVSLAACIAMIQVNLLLPLMGRSNNSFVILDIMRLPLGILSGMGFIGAGAIVRRGNLVTGVTTAAGMWFVTVTGLCFGGGQIGLGWAGTAVGFGVLAAVKPLEDRMQRRRSATLVLVTDPAGPQESDVHTLFERAGFTILQLGFTAAADRNTICCTVEWRALASDTTLPSLITLLRQKPGVLCVSWRPQIE